MELKKPIRLESIRVIVDKMLLGINDAEERRCAYLHLYGVSQSASLLALKRGLDPEIGAIAGMLHDFYTYATGTSKFHDQNGAETVRPLIRDLGIFTNEEQKTILKAIFHHSDKKNVHTEYDELLKDADAFQHYLYNVNEKVRAVDAGRVKKVLEELSLPTDFVVDETQVITKTEVEVDKRSLLADIAESTASKKIAGTPGDEDYRNICRFWPGDNIYKELKNGWCAAFVYYCCRKAGFLLPIRHPNGMCRFAGVGAWQEWAKFSEMNFFHDFSETGFIPGRGDIVIYEKLISEDSHDHMGVVLSSDKDSILVAEGNVDNKNQSGVVQRSASEKISGFIRIDNKFKYSFNGKYEPRLD